MEPQEKTETQETHDLSYFPKSSLDQYQPSKKFVFGVRFFEIVCGIIAVGTLGYTAGGHKHLYGDVPNWVTYGLVVSCVGTVISTIFIIDANIKYALLEGLTSSIWACAYLTYVVFGAINTPSDQDCGKLNGWERPICSNPKATEFFAFVAIFAYGFSATTGFRVWLDRRNRLPQSDKNVV
ncbi:12797_t:CDS:1 [Ambispora gerdemannii]|uniref:12797_t:CDS:1 n=1 Tax=Ambispora gerdemannii TaxID=144530 RepID=A0A9N9B4Y8_9GLOM|nr:12797_t:CDS:1 [Ambispora gerdemannii]